VSGGRPGKNAVIRCCVVRVRVCCRFVVLSELGGRPGVLSMIVMCGVDVGVLVSCVVLDGATVLDLC
jgi:hypothetical protein